MHVWSLHALLVYALVRFFFFNDTATTEIYTLSLHDALPILGVGMAPRGEVGLIFAQIGLTAGILSNRLFSAILFVVIATTLVTPPLLQWTLRGRGATLDEDSAS